MINKGNLKDEFSFTPGTKLVIAKQISNLMPGKAVCSSNIPTKILKDFEGLFATFPS